MTPADAARVLAKCATYDRRTIGVTDVGAWYEAIGDLDVESALWAVARWYGEHREWLMPSDVRDLARPQLPPYWRPVGRLSIAPIDPEVARNGIAACRAALVAARMRRQSA